MRTAYLVAPEADAADAVQDGFLKAYAALARFRTGAPFRPWLLRIVANEARNRRRSADRRTGLALRASGQADAAAVADSPEAEFLAGEARGQLRAAFAQLARRGPRGDRRPLLPRAVRGGDGRGAGPAGRHREVADLAGARPVARGSRGDRREAAMADQPTCPFTSGPTRTSARPCV